MKEFVGAQEHCQMPFLLGFEFTSHITLYYILITILQLLQSDDIIAKPTLHSLMAFP